MIPNKGIIRVFILGCFFWGPVSHGQGLAVYDNTNFVSLAKQLAESAKQTSQLMQTVDFLRQQKQRLEEVSTVVRQLQSASALIRNHQQLYGKVQGELRSIVSSPYIRPEESDQIIQAFDGLLERSMHAVDYVNQVLTGHLLKMSDADRARILEEHHDQSIEMLAEAESKTRRYRTIISFRKLQDHLNNRITSYE